MAVSAGPVFDPGVATPAPGAAAGFLQTVSDTRQDAADSLTDYHLQSTRAAQQYNDVQAPQLQGSIASSGNWFSNATGAQPAIGEQEANYQNSQTDLKSSVQRHLDSLTQQRNWAAIGLIV